MAFLLAAALLAVGANRLFGRGDPVLGRDDAPIMLAWTSDPLLPKLTTAARQAEGIGAVAEARNGVGWLNSWGPDGGQPLAAPSGYMVPVEILAVDPEDYAEFIPPGERSRFTALQEGGALMGATGASFRGIEGEGSLSFSEATIPVRGVVPDELVASHEVVVSNETAAQLGITDRKYLLIELERGTSRDEAEEELRTLLPSGARLDLRPPGESEVFRPGGKILTQADIKRRFGEFAGRPGRGRNIQVDPKWIDENTANVTIPLLGTARCHRKVIPQIQAAFREVAAQNLDGLIRRGDFGGCFAPRLLNDDPHSGISHHAWGIAFDFNVSRNPYGAKPNMDPRLVELLDEWGFTWGGLWEVPDGMHYEYLREADS